MSLFETKHGVAFGFSLDGGRIMRLNHSYRTYGMYPVSIKIAAPEVNTSGIYVPGMDGMIDTTDTLDGVVHYKNRKAEFKFKQINSKGRWQETYHELLGDLHGKKRNIIVDDDSSGYYVGRFTVDMPQTEKVGADEVVYFTVNGDLKPYQYDFTTTGEGWLWYPFRFTKDSIRRAYRSIRYTGTEDQSQELITSDMPVVPNIVITGSARYNPVGRTAEKHPDEEGWYERTGTAPNYLYLLTSDHDVVTGKTYYTDDGIVTGINVTYVNVYDETKTKTVEMEDTDTTAKFSDLILCSLRSKNVFLTVSLVGTNLTERSWATVMIDYETGRL